MGAQWNNSKKRQAVWSSLTSTAIFLVSNSQFEILQMYNGIPNKNETEFLQALPLFFLSHAREQSDSVRTGE